MRVTSHFKQCFIALWFATSTPATAEVPLPIDSDSCAIAYALTGAAMADCPEPNLSGRVTRSVSMIDWSGYFVHFDFNSNSLTAESQGHLQRLSSLLNNSLGDLCVMLVGHTDTVGSRAYNKSLSTKRANSVRLYIAGPGAVEASRLRAQGQGELSPISGISGDDARNRRVEILARPSTVGQCP